MDGKIRLTELASELGVTSSALRQHLKNKSPLGEGATKFGNRQTGDYLLSIGSVLDFIGWARGKGRKLKVETLDRVEEDVKCLIQ